MAPKPKTLDDLSWLPDQVDPEEEKKKRLKAALDQLPDQHAPDSNRPEERSWPEAIVSQGLRIIPGVAGGILGGTAGSIVPFAGTMGGVALGGGAGAALGETAGEAFDKWMGRRDNINPYEIATQGALGAIPLMGETPGATATAKELGKYALRAPIRGAVEGGVLGGVGSIPAAWAEGRDTPDLSEVLKAGAGGAAFGAVGGAALGSYPSMRKARALEAIANAPSNTNVNLNVPPPATPPPAATVPPPTPAKDHIIEVNPADTGAVKNFEQQGYKSAGVGPNGKFFMVRQGGPPPAGPPVVNIPPTTGQSVPAVGNTISYHPDDPIVIPRSQMSATLFQKFKDQGIEFQGVTQDGDSVFKDMSGQRADPDEAPFARGEPANVSDADALALAPIREPTHQMDVTGTGEVSPLDIHSQNQLQNISDVPPGSEVDLAPDEASRIQSYDPRLDRSEIQRANPEELQTIRQTVVDDIAALEKHLNELPPTANRSYVGGSKRRITQAKNRLAEIDAELKMRELGVMPQAPPDEASRMADPDIPGSGFKKGMSFEEQWQQAINHAEVLGIKWQDHTNLEDLQMAITRRNAEIIMKTGKDPLNSNAEAEDPIKYGFEMAQMEHAIRGDKYLELDPWEPRESDPPEIAEKRRELNDLNFEQEVLLFEEKPGAEGPVLSPEKEARFNQLYDEIGEFDKYGPTQGLSSMRNPEFENQRVVDLFEKGLPEVTHPRDAHFILPSGKLIGAGRWDTRIHAEHARRVGSSLEEALRSGVVRFKSGVGIETNGPITHEQAQTALDAMMMDGKSEFFVDGQTPNLNRGFWLPIDVERTSAAKLMNMVNKNFDPNFQEPSFMARATGKSDDDFLRMELGERVDMLRNMQGQYAESGARVANKELLQNAIDATETGGKVSVNLNYRTTGKGPSINVTDTGPGLPIDMLRNQYVKLTGSGKRGVGAASGRKSIGEMGVGKATYLLGTDSFEIETVAREPDGSVWKYEMSGNPDSMIGEDVNGNPVDPTPIHKTRMPDDAQTGTSVTVYDSNIANISAAERYLKHFATYSATPVEVSLKGNQYMMAAHDLNETVPVRASSTGQLVSSGTAPGGDFSITIPDDAVWNKANSIQLVLNNRGMFQGVEVVNIFPPAKIPGHVVVNIEPNVPASNGKLYPLTAPTRERMKDDFAYAVKEAVKKDIGEKAQENAVRDLQDAYNALTPAVNPKTGTPNPFVIHDSGHRYTPEELARLNNSPRIQAFASVMKRMLDTLDSLFPTEQVGGKTSQFGLLIEDRGSGGVNLPNPSLRGAVPKNAVLVNYPDAILHVGDLGPRAAARRLLHIIKHEFTHNIKRAEDDTFTWAFADTDSRFPMEDQIAAQQDILRTLTGPDGDYAPEIQEIVRDYIAARRRPDTQVDLLKRSGDRYVLAAPGPEAIPNNGGSDGEGASRISGQPPTVPPTVPPAGGSGGLTRPPGEPDKPLSVVREAINFTRGATTTGDLSAPMRQGLPLIYRKEWWKSWKQQLTSLGSEDAYQANLAALKRRPMFQSRIDLDPNSRTFGKKTKSFAEQAGIKLSDVSTGMNNREEAVASNWLESGEMLGHGIAQKAYKGTIGRYARATNRAYTAFLNQLRADTFEALIKDAERDFQAGTKGSKSPMKDLPYAREIADFVNTATGKGPLRMARPSVEGGRLHLKEANFERNAQLLTDVLFAPRLFASRMRMLNPLTYAMASPFARKQYLKSALAVAGAWGTASSLGYMAGQAGIADVDVSLDPNSADFGKMRINNTRLDPAGGFQQYLVALSRFLSGRTTSSATQRDTELGAGFHADTRKDIAERFMVNKLTPVMKFGWDLMAASQYQPFHVADRTAQMFVPLIVQDVIELSKEDPSLLPLIGPIATGMGSQSYDKGETTGKLVPTEHDWILQGGDPTQRDWAEDIPDF